MRRPAAFLGMALALPALVQVRALPSAEWQPSPEERAFVALLERGQSIEAREGARAHLAGHPDSFVACLVIASVFHDLDGDLPRAEHYLGRARSLLERRYASPWEEDAPWRIYAKVLNEQYWVLEGMDRYQEALEVLRLRDSHFFPKYPSLYGWPLMKLGKVEEARRRMAEALEDDRPLEVGNALNTLGAIEAETERYEQALEVSTRLYLMEHGGPLVPTCTPVRNHGEHLEKVGRLEEAERVYLEATRLFDPQSYSNPWKDLVWMYLNQQRLPEALDATKRMQQWAYRSSPSVALGNWNTRRALTASLLLHCGRTEEALAVARRLAELPDRHGGDSSLAEVWSAGALLLHHLALEDALARDDEELSWSPWKAKPGLWMRRAGHALARRSAGRRCARVIMGKPGLLQGALRHQSALSPITTPGSAIRLPALLGPGVVEAEAYRLLARRGPAADRERGFLLLQVGAARLERGDAAGALQALAWAEQTLNSAWALLHTQLLALRAQAQERLGDRPGALRTMLAILARDPGALRRFGLRLPCRVESDGSPAAQEAARLLAGSPRLEVGRGPFRVIVSSSGGALQGGLDGPGGEILCRFRVNPGPDPGERARDFCRTFHQKAFSPRIDLTQQQIHSLSGSTLAAEDMNQQLKGLLGGEESREP